MQTFYVVHADPKWGLSVDVWGYRRSGAMTVRCYFNVTRSSAERMRHLWREARSRVAVFDLWSAARVDLYRRWCSRRRVRDAGAPSLDHIETSEPPRRQKRA